MEKINRERTAPVIMMIFFSYGSIGDIECVLNSGKH
jgi:hypothetical protein